MSVVKVERGNDLYFPQGNENGDHYEPLWLASINDGKKYHGTTPSEAYEKCINNQGERA